VSFKFGASGRVQAALADGSFNGVFATVGADQFDDAPTNRLFTKAALAIWNPGSSIWEKLRTPSLSKQASGTANFNIWTPAAGKKFRILAYVLGVTNRAAAAAAVDGTFQFFDSGTLIPGFSHVVTIPAAAGPVGPPLYLFGDVVPGNGYLSLVANNSFSIVIPALTAGLCYVNAWGTEE
jgi:hypothetical protein